MKYKLYILVFVLIILFILRKYVFCKYLSEVRYQSTGKVSVIIINYKRPHNVREQLKCISKYPEIDEIIVTHGNREKYEEFPNVKNIQNFEDKYGATERFFAADKAKNDILLFLDDDHIPSRKLVQDLLNHMIDDPYMIYGPYSRSCNNRNGYKLSYGKYIDFMRRNYKHDTVITPILMTHKKVNDIFLQNFYKEYAEILEKTHGNGEDICFNHCFRKFFKKTPTVVNGKYRTLDTKTAAYSGKKLHHQIRNDMCYSLN